MSNQAKIIVFGNEKGGSGKSTAALHTAVALLRQGWTVGTLDLDARQGTMTRYLKNRWHTASEKGWDLPIPVHMDIEPARADSHKEAERQEQQFFGLALRELLGSCDAVVIDTPGAQTRLSLLAHGAADILVTPINDSWIDLDVLARIDSQSHAIQRPSHYAQIVMDLRAARQKAGEGSKPDWFVMRNRLSHISARNKEDIDTTLKNLSDSFGFRYINGFGERVIFRELFLSGMTLLDLADDPDYTPSLSLLTARQEVRNLLASLALDQVKKESSDRKKEDMTHEP